MKRLLVLFLVAIVVQACFSPIKKEKVKPVGFDDVVAQWNAAINKADSNWIKENSIPALVWNDEQQKELNHYFGTYPKIRQQVLNTVSYERNPNGNLRGSFSVRLTNDEVSYDEQFEMVLDTIGGVKIVSFQPYNVSQYKDHLRRLKWNVPENALPIGHKNNVVDNYAWILDEKPTVLQLGNPTSESISFDGYESLTFEMMEHPLDTSRNVLVVHPVDSSGMFYEFHVFEWRNNAWQLLINKWALHNMNKDTVAMPFLRDPDKPHLIKRYYSVFDIDNPNGGWSILHESVAPYSN